MLHAPPLVIQLPVVDIGSKGVLVLFWRRGGRDERELDEGVDLPADGAVLVLLQPAEDAAGVELVPAGQFEVPLPGLPLDQADGAVDRCGGSGLHAVLEPRGIDDQSFPWPIVIYRLFLYHSQDFPLAFALLAYHFSGAFLAFDHPSFGGFRGQIFFSDLLHPCLPALFEFPDALEDLGLDLFFEAALAVAGRAGVGEPGLEGCGGVFHLRAESPGGFCFEVREEAVVAERAGGGLAMGGVV